MNAVTIAYTDSVLVQAISLPDILRPLFLDESMREASLKMNELVHEMKAIMQVTCSLSARTARFHDIEIGIEKQARLEQAISDSKKLTKEIRTLSLETKWHHFKITFKARKLAKHAKKTLKNINVIEKNLTRFFRADEFEILLYNAKKNGELPSDNPSVIVTQQELDKLASRDYMEKCASGLAMLEEKANKATRLH